MSNNYQLSISKIYRKNIFRIARAFIFWSIVYTIYYYIDKVFILKKEVALTTIITHIISGHYHMWFLYMIAGIYMILPFLQQIASSKFLTKYFLILAFVIAIIFSQSENIFLIFFPAYRQDIGSIYNNMRVNLVMGFTIYFLLGHVINEMEIPKKIEFILYVLGISGFIATFLLSYLSSIFLQEATWIFHDTHTINVFLESVSLFVFFKKHVNFEIVCKKWLILLSKYSFGAYLVHAIIIYILNILGLNTISFNPVLSIPVISVIVFIISFFISGIFNNAPILRKFV